MGKDQRVGTYRKLYLAPSFNIRYIYGGHVITVEEGIFTDFGHAVGYSDGCQAEASIKSRMADGSHAVAHDDGGQAFAALKSKIVDRNNAVWDGDRGQVEAIMERFITYRSHTIIRSFVCDRLGYHHATCVFVGITGHFGSLAF